MTTEPIINLTPEQESYIEDFIRRWDDTIDGWEIEDEQRHVDSLSKEFEKYCLDNDLPQWSADEILMANKK